MIFTPTDYQRGMYERIAEIVRHFDPLAKIPPIDDQPDNGDGDDNLIINIEGFRVVIPPSP